MAKTSQIAREKKRAALIEKYQEKRKQLTDIIKNLETSAEDRREAYKKLSQMPRNACSTRKKFRCRITGRSRGYLRKFGMSRISFRELALEGKIPGVTKSSW
jgi:small subunit ribosomal protein S14